MGPWDRGSLYPRIGRLRRACPRTEGEQAKACPAIWAAAWRSGAITKITPGSQPREQESSRRGSGSRVREKFANFWNSAGFFGGDRNLRGAGESTKRAIMCPIGTMPKRLGARRFLRQSRVERRFDVNDGANWHHLGHRFPIKEFAPIIPSFPEISYGARRSAGSAEAAGPSRCGPLRGR